MNYVSVRVISNNHSPQHYAPFGIIGVVSARAAACIASKEVTTVTVKFDPEATRIKIKWEDGEKVRVPDCKSLLISQVIDTRDLELYVDEDDPEREWDE